MPSTATVNLTLLYAAFRKAGVTLAPQRVQSASMLTDAILEENRMIEGWNLDPLLILGERLDIYDTIANQQSYSIGFDPSGNLTPDWAAAARPQKIIRANLLMPTATGPIAPVRRPIEIYDVRQWAAKQYQAVYTYPEGLYPQFNDPNNPPFSRYYFYPIPDAIYQIELISWQKLSKFVATTDNVLLPDGFEDAIVNNLAVRLASMPWTVQRPMNPQVAIDAKISLSRLRQFAASSPALATEGELCEGNGWYNYYSGLVEP